MQETLKIQRSVFDLDTFDEVTLIKQPVIDVPESVDAAIARYAGNETALLAVIQDGVRAAERRKHYANLDGFHTFANEENTEVNGPFNGTPADMKAVNALVLTLAKTIFGYNSDAPLDARKAAKESAKNLIKSNDAMKEGLRKSAAVASSESESA